MTTLDDRLIVSETLDAELVEAPRVVLRRVLPTWARVPVIARASFVVAGRAMGGKTLARPPHGSALPLDVCLLTARLAAGGGAYGGRRG